MVKLLSPSQGILTIALIAGLVLGLVVGQGIVAPAVAGSSEVGGQAPPALGQTSYMTDGWYNFLGIGQASMVSALGVPGWQRIIEVPGLQVTPMYAWGFFPESQEMLGEYTWSDLHHIEPSQTNGVYDGRWMYTNEKGPSNRVSKIDLRTMITVDVAAVPGLQGNHGFESSPNSQYIGMNGEFRIPVKVTGERSKGGLRKEDGVTWDDVEIDWAGMNDSEKYRSEVHILDGDTLDEVCRVITPGGGVDLSDWDQTGRYYFVNAYNEENSTSVKGSTEAAMSPTYVIDAKDCEYETTLQMTSKNAHGVAVNPSNQYAAIAMKLYPGLSFINLQNEGFYNGNDPNPEPDPESFKVVRIVQTGDGPLHPWYDDRGNIFTGEFIDSDVVKVKYKPEGYGKRFDDPKKMHVVDREQAFYIVGHSRGVEMKSISPDNLYGWTLMKLSRDRFINVGPDKPENEILHWLDYGAGEHTDIKFLKETPHDPEPHDGRAVARMKMTYGMPDSPKVDLPMYPPGYRKAKPDNLEAVKTAMNPEEAEKKWNLPSMDEVRYSKYVVEDHPPFVRDWVEAGYDQSTRDDYLSSEAPDGSGRTVQQYLLAMFEKYPYRKMAGVPRPVAVPEGTEAIPSGEAITSQVVKWKAGAMYMEPTQDWQDRVETYSGSPQVYRDYP